MKVICQVILFTIYVLPCAGQIDYNDYHRRINEAESLFFVKDQAGASLQIYDGLLSQYEFVFVKDFFIAAQIACKSHDNKRLNNYLKACFNNGLNIAQLSLSPLFVSQGMIQKNVQLLSAYKVCRTRYLARIDLNYLAVVYQIFSEDQVAKSLDRALYNEKLQANMNKLIGFISTKGFPSDQLIGIDDSSIRVQGMNLHEWYRKYCDEIVAEPFTEIGRGDNYSLSACSIMPFLIHHPCAYQKLSPYLDAEVRKGNIHPRDVALLYDNMMQMRKLSGSTILACNPPGKYYYKLNKFCVYPDNWQQDVIRIDSMRRTLNICSISQDSIKKAKAADYGFYNRFGFWSCR